MPRGDNPNSRANLNKSYNGRGGFDTDTARKANKNSQKAKKQYKTLTEALKDQCTAEEMQQLTAMLLKRAKAGNLKAYELLRDQMGEKPIERVEQTSVTVSVEFED